MYVIAISVRLRFLANWSAFWLGLMSVPCIGYPEFSFSHSLSVADKSYIGNINHAAV